MQANETFKSVLIGGIGGGIGNEIARKALGAGYSVAGFGREGSSLARFRDEFPDVPVFTVDATNAAEVKEGFSLASEAMGSIGAYVHAIGSVFLRPAHLTSDVDWHSVLAINLHSAFYASREALKVMRKQKYGHLLFFSSVASQIGLSNHEAIAAAKGGIDGLVKSLAASYAPFGIRANAIALGLVETPSTAELVSSDAGRAISQRMHPVGDIGNPASVASLATWMLSDDAQWMTGEIWPFDGGMSRVLPKPRA